MLTDDVKGRVEAVVPELASRVQEAAELSELVRKGQLPQSPAAGFVLPLGLRAASPGDAAANAFTQMIEEVVGVLLVVRSAGDASGGRALPKISDLADATIAAIAGWGPADEPGVFRVSRGQLLSASDGAVLYQLDFSISRQVRVLT